MRTTVSLIVIVFSIVAIGAGYLSGRSTAVPSRAVAIAAAPQSVAMPAPAAFERSLRGAHSLDAADAPLPAIEEEDAVVANDPATGSLSDNAQVSLVLAGAGRSLKLEAGFLDLPVPLAVIVDPDADDVQAVGAAVFERGKSLYMRVPSNALRTVAVLGAALDGYRKAFPSLSGVAVHFDPDEAAAQARVVAAALRGRALGVLDLSGAGPTARAVLTNAGIHVRRRDVTIDNRDEGPYVKFMLAQAVQVARGRGNAVIVAHPNPESLAAVSALVANRWRDGVNFTGL